MTTRAEIVREARAWIGTRWHHQASSKGVGCDCIGLLRGVAIETGLVPRDWHLLPGVPAYMGYSRHAHGGTLERFCEQYLQGITEAEAGPGDLVVMQFGGQAHHMAILGDHMRGGLSIIHAYAPLRRVVESRLDDSFRARVVSWHRYPGVQA